MNTVFADNLGRFISKDEIRADLGGISNSTLRRMIERGEMPPLKPLGSSRIIGLWEKDYVAAKRQLAKQSECR